MEERIINTAEVDKKVDIEAGIKAGDREAGRDIAHKEREEDSYNYEDIEEEEEELKELM